MSNDMNRRDFARRCAVLAAASALPATAIAEDAKVDENSPQAMALGYRHDARTVDKAKFPNFAEGNICDNCQLYQGGAEWGKCGIFPGKLVNAKGWCSAWVKKAG